MMPDCASGCHFSREKFLLVCIYGSFGWITEQCRVEYSGTFVYYECSTSSEYWVLGQPSGYDVLLFLRAAVGAFGWGALWPSTFMTDWKDIPSQCGHLRGEYADLPSPPRPAHRRPAAVHGALHFQCSSPPEIHTHTHIHTNFTTTSSIWRNNTYKHKIQFKCVRTYELKHRLAKCQLAIEGTVTVMIIQLTYKLNLLMNAHSSLQQE